MVPVKIHGRPLSSWKIVISKMYEFLATLGIILSGFDVSPAVSYILHDCAVRQQFLCTMCWRF